MAYPAKLKKCALQAVRIGHPKAEVSKMFRLVENTLRDWESLEAETRPLENRPLNRIASKIDREKLLQWCREKPYRTNQEAAMAFHGRVSGIRGANKFLGITRKKNTLEYAERNGQKRESLSLK